MLELKISDEGPAEQGNDLDIKEKTVVIRRSAGIKEKDRLNKEKGHLPEKFPGRDVESSSRTRPWDEAQRGM